MGHKPPPIAHHCAFTLLELLIVLLIISIILLFALWQAGDFGASRRQELAAQHLQQLIKLASEQAILQSVTLGLGTDHDHYQFYRYHKTDEHDEWSWQVITGDRLLKRQILPDMTEYPFDRNKPPPQLIFYPNGVVERL